MPRKIRHSKKDGFRARGPKPEHVRDDIPMVTGTILDEVHRLEKKRGMAVGPEAAKIIGYSSTGRPIYDPFNHPENKNLKSSELERPMFHAYEQSKKNAEEMRNQRVGSPEYERYKVQFQHHHTKHKQLSKLWRSALTREKKASSTQG